MGDIFQIYDKSRNAKPCKAAPLQQRSCGQSWLAAAFRESCAFAYVQYLCMGKCMYSLLSMHYSSDWGFRSFRYLAVSETTLGDDVQDQECLAIVVDLQDANASSGAKIVVMAGASKVTAQHFNFQSLDV